MEDQPATPQEACREYAQNVGMEKSKRAWILTSFDSWEPNPFYNGPPVPHPEYDFDDDDYEEVLE